MADKVRYVMRKNETYDVYLRDLVAQRGYGRERHYAGVADQPTADQIRKALRNAGRHLGISVKAYWQVCDDNSCPASPCNYHVVYSAYDPADARRYKAAAAKRQAIGIRPRRHS